MWCNLASNVTHGRRPARRDGFEAIATGCPNVLGIDPAGILSASELVGHVLVIQSWSARPLAFDAMLCHPPRERLEIAEAHAQQHAQRHQIQNSGHFHDESCSSRDLIPHALQPLDRNLLHTLHDNHVQDTCCRDTGRWPVYVRKACQNALEKDVQNWRFLDVQPQQILHRREDGDERGRGDESAEHRPRDEVQQETEVEHAEQGDDQACVEC
mmetsp:Transcript_85099/g.237434  ORF Transcript_85099/g.237434 Transcript_85099/m.237434 type:complete len:213 (+) Transcript_85099:2043-2681(+)